ncbi:DUF389 domain-containing protein, partial [bacterium]|nr:DUF389 domain-containing protein [bacterium]
RPGLMGALPGVAIAAALVPPLASAGICLARSETALGVGAASLFGINLIAIILASAATLYCLGVKPPDLKKPLRLWARRAVEVLLIVALVISFPLTIRLFQQINPASTSQIHELHAIWPQTSTLKTIEIPRDTPDQIILNIDTSQPLTSEQIKELHTLLVKYYKRTLKLEVRQTIVAHIENSW